MALALFKLHPLDDEASAVGLCLRLAQLTALLTRAVLGHRLGLLGTDQYDFARGVADPWPAYLLRGQRHNDAMADHSYLVVAA